MRVAQGTKKNVFGRLPVVQGPRLFLIPQSQRRFHQHTWKYESFLSFLPSHAMFVRSRLRSTWPYADVTSYNSWMRMPPPPPPPKSWGSVSVGRGIRPCRHLTLAAAPLAPPVPLAFEIPTYLQFLTVRTAAARPIPPCSEELRYSRGKWRRFA